MDELGGEVDHHHESDLKAVKDGVLVIQNRNNFFLTQASVLPIIEALLGLRSQQHYLLVIALNRYN